MKWKIRKDSERTDEELIKQKKFYDAAAIFASLAAFTIMGIYALTDSLLFFVLGLSVTGILIANASIWFMSASETKFELRLREALREHEAKGQNLTSKTG